VRCRGLGKREIRRRPLTVILLFRPRDNDAMVATGRGGHVRYTAIGASAGDVLVHRGCCIYLSH